MTLSTDPELWWIFQAILTVLAVSTLIAIMLSRRITNESRRATMVNVIARIRSWWVLCAIFFLVLLAGTGWSFVLFALVSLLALREYLTLIPTRRADHRILLWSVFIVAPLQYVLAWIGFYGLFSIMIPVYVFVLIPTRIALSGDTENFLERAAEIQWGSMICVYSLSHAPALLILGIPGYESQNAKLLLYLVLVDQLSDVLQYLWGKLLGRNLIAPRVSPNKTWEGFLGGAGSATLIGAALCWVTPFKVWEAAALSLAVTLLGFAGGLTMSAIKRDRGVKDYGTLIPGHGGILDRIDSLCFAAPVFFHLTRYFFS